MSSKIKYIVGLRLETKSNGFITLIDKLPNRKFKVRFDDGYEKITTDRALRDGEIRNPYHPSLCGVGYVGEGYKCYDGKKITKVYSCWSLMIIRCYGDPSINTSYNNKTVCNEWHNFQNFAKWFEDNYVEGWQLDKDLLIQGNTTYSPNSCCFLPISINASIASLAGKSGVHFNAKTNFYQVGYYNLETGKRTGTAFKDKYVAEEFHNENKFNYLKLPMNLYRNQLSTNSLKRLEQICAQ